MAVYPVIFKTDIQHLDRKLQNESLSRLARSAVQESAKQLGVTVSKFHKTPEGQPMAENGIFWSLSHKKSFVIGVACDQRVGIDCEELKPRSEGLLKAIAVPEEHPLFRQRNISVVELFSAKEAVLKAYGSGIKDLRNCRLIAEKGAWLVFEFAENTSLVQQTQIEDHVFSIACSNEMQITWMQQLAP